MLHSKSGKRLLVSNFTIPSFRYGPVDLMALILVEQPRNQPPRRQPSKVDANRRARRQRNSFEEAAGSICAVSTLRVLCRRRGGLSETANRGKGLSTYRRYQPGRRRTPRTGILFPKSGLARYDQSAEVACGTGQQFARGRAGRFRTTWWSVVLLSAPIVAGGRLGSGI